MRENRSATAVLVGAMATVLAGGLAQGADAPKAAAAASGKQEMFTYGGDIRIREEHFDKFPNTRDLPDVSTDDYLREGENNYFRFRTRVWGQLDPQQDLTIRARMVNEFREYTDGSKADEDAWEFPDELIVDQLYVEMRNLLDKQMDVRVGRQDVIFGTGKLLLEGTPKDGSRTIYMDAAKLTWKGVDKTTIDVFGIYDQPESHLAINSQDRDLTGLGPGYNDMTDSGAGVYLQNKSVAEMPFEAYYIWKNESDWEMPKGKDLVEVQERDTHTMGMRLMPKWSESVEGSAELAYQRGQGGEMPGEPDRDIAAFGADVSLKYRLPVMEEYKPAVSAGYYYLSGDDPDTADRDEAWSPLWARYPQYSELYVFCWPWAGEWSNLSMPHVDFTCAPAKKVVVNAMVAKLEAVEDDGPGPGKDRGLLGVIWSEFTLAEKLFTQKDKLSAHLWLEVLDPGDYYNTDAIAHFARWQLFYAF